MKYLTCSEIAEKIGANKGVLGRIVSQNHVSGSSTKISAGHTIWKYDIAAQNRIVSLYKNYCENMKRRKEKMKDA